MTSLTNYDTKNHRNDLIIDQLLADITEDKELYAKILSKTFDYTINNNISERHAVLIMRGVIAELPVHVIDKNLVGILEHIRDTEAVWLCQMVENIKTKFATL